MVNWIQMRRLKSLRMWLTYIFFSVCFFLLYWTLLRNLIEMFRWSLLDLWHSVIPLPYKTFGCCQHGHKASWNTSAYWCCSLFKHTHGKEAISCSQSEQGCFKRIPDKSNKMDMSQIICKNHTSALKKRTAFLIYNASFFTAAYGDNSSACLSMLQSHDNWSSLGVPPPTSMLPMSHSTGPPTSSRYVLF